MIHKNLNWEEHAHEQVLSMVKPKDKTHEFSVPYIIVLFCFSELPGCSPNYEFLAMAIPLEQGST
jgi:hypothetical protein